MTSVSEFQYGESLSKVGPKYSPTTIRIVMLLPRSTHSEEQPTQLHLQLRLVDLDRLGLADTYEALSYRWEPETPKQDVIINKVFHSSIGANLHAALTQLQPSTPSPPRNLWIDALCINQKDGHEKTNQIALMGRIYSSARRGVVWLGPEADGSSLALERLELLAEAKRMVHAELGPGVAGVSSSDGPPLTLRLMLTDGTEEGEHRVQKQLDEHVAFIRESRHNALKLQAHCIAAAEAVGFEIDSWLPAMIALAKRGYWARAWIRQELTLSRDPEIWCGSKCVGWDDLTGGYTALMSAVEDDGPDRVRAIDEDRLLSDFNAAVQAHLLPLIQFRRQFRDSQLSGEAYTRKLVSGAELRYGNSFKDVICDLTILTHSSCTEPRDRILSLLGLATDLKIGSSASLFHFDQSSTANEVFTEATKALIRTCWDEREHVFRILTYARYIPGSDAAGVPSLAEPLHDITTGHTLEQPAGQKAPRPSWVPDWSQPLAVSICGSFDKEMFSAGRLGIPVELNLTPSQVLLPNNVLRVPVVHFDQVLDVGASIDEVLATIPNDKVAARAYLDSNSAFLYGAAAGRFHPLSMVPTTLADVSKRGPLPYGLPNSTEYTDAIAHTFICGRAVDPYAKLDFYGIAEESLWILHRSSLIEETMFRILTGQTTSVPEGFLYDRAMPIVERRRQFVKKYVDVMLKMAWGRRPVFTWEGRIGMVPACVQPDDKIVILFGAPAPFVVRSIDRQGSEGPRHIIIGECYIHGVMSGEIVRQKLIPQTMMEFE